MTVLVAYATRHGATQGIAERIAATLRREGLEVDLRAASSVGSVAEYDACVIGGAAYLFHWLKEATDLVRRNRPLLATKPVWLFSSGPLGTEPVDDQGRDQKETAIPKELPELADAIHAREQKVFFGAFDPSQPPIGLFEKLASHLPAGPKNAMPTGDFRDWAEIEAWAVGIAHDLKLVPVG